MNAFVALIFSTHTWLALVLIVGIEWWAVWFTLGRNFSTTLVLTLIANACSLGGVSLLVWSGALGPAAGEVQAHPFSWVMAFLGLWIWSWLLEMVSLRRMMRISRKKWEWDPYDLAVLAISNALSLGLAAVLTLKFELP